MKNLSLPLHIDGTILEQKHTYKILGTLFQENLNWDEAVKHVISSCYATLSVLGRIKHLTPHNVKKQLVQSVIFSKLNYNSTVFFPFSLQLESKLQKVQNGTIGFITNKYSRESDIIKLAGLPIHEQLQYNILKLTYKALYSSTWPVYVRIEKVCISRI